MKKVAFILSFVFVAMLGFNSYAAISNVEKNNTVMVVDIDHDKKPCPANCEGDCCKDKKVENKNVESKVSTTKESSNCESKCTTPCCSKKSSIESTKAAKK